MKKIVTIGLTILAIFLLLGCLGSSSNNSENTKSDNTQSDDTQPTSEPAQAPTEEQTVYKVGDRVAVGDRAYTITNVKTTAFVGDEYTKQEASGVFVLVSMTIENTGKESSMMSSNDVKIVDSQGRTFESDTNAWATLKDNILLKQIQPGLPVTGETVFDVPKGIDANLQVTDGGWTTEPVNISLGTIQ